MAIGYVAISDIDHLRQAVSDTEEALSTAERAEAIKLHFESKHSWFTHYIAGFAYGKRLYNQSRDWFNANMSAALSETEDPVVLALLRSVKSADDNGTFVLEDPQTGLIPNYERGTAARQEADEAGREALELLEEDGPAAYTSGGTLNDSARTQLLVARLATAEYLAALWAYNPNSNAVDSYSGNRLTTLNLARMDEAAGQLQAALSALGDLGVSSSATSLMSKVGAQRTGLLTQAEAAVGGLNQSAAQMRALHRDGREIIFDRIDTLLDEVHADVQKAEEATQLLQEQARLTITVVTGLVVVVGVLVGAMLARSVVRPIRELTTVADEVRGGNLAVKVRISGDDEVRDLGNAFKQMVASLRLLTSDDSKQDDADDSTDAKE